VKLVIQVATSDWVSEDGEVAVKSQIMFGQTWLSNKENQRFFTKTLNSLYPVLKNFNKKQLKRSYNN
jgi:hypothetical protein